MAFIHILGVKTARLEDAYAYSYHEGNVCITGLRRPASDAI